MSDLPPSTHNLAPFDPKTVVDLEILADQLRATYGHLFKERDGYLAALDAFKTAHPKGIETDNDQAAATDMLAQHRTFLAAVHGKDGSVHATAKAPFLHGGRIVDAVLNTELAGTLRDADAVVEGWMKTFAVNKAAAARRAAQEAAAKAAQEAAEAAARDSGADDDEAAMLAEQAAAEAAAAAASQKAAQVSMTRGDYGTSSGLRTKWVAKVVDEDKLPRKYMSPNMSAIELALKQSRDKKTGAPTITIPGVEFVEEASLAIRK